MVGRFCKDTKIAGSLEIGGQVWFRLGGTLMEGSEMTHVSL